MNNPLVVSYITLRRLIGIAGVALPFVLLSTGERDSISNYYYSDARDLFVGILVAISAFLCTYNGYDARDAITGRIAAIGALAVALIPHQGPHAPLHFAGAVTFLAAMAYFCYLFSLSTDSGENAWLRKLTYQGCAAFIIGGLFGTVLGVIFDFSIFWPESIAVWAFGLSWLVKGQFLVPQE